MLGHKTITEDLLSQHLSNYMYKYTNNFRFNTSKFENKKKVKFTRTLVNSNYNKEKTGKKYVQTANT